MNTYRITEEWDVFEQYIVEFLNGINTNRVCYMHKGNEIYIRFSDNRIKEIISKTYTLIPCDPPDSYINDGWVFLGNAGLFL